MQERRLDEALKPLGLTRTTWCAMLAIGNEHLRQPSDIAAFVGIDRTAASRALRQMEAAELIERSAGDIDGRTRSVALTAKGAALLRKATPMAEENNAIMHNNLSAAERDKLILLLQQTHADESVPLARL